MEETVPQTPTNGNYASVFEATAMERLTDSVKSLGHGELSEGASSLIQVFVVPAAGGLLALLASYFVAKFLSHQVRHLVCQRVDETLGKFIAKMVFYAIVILAVTIILPTVGIQVTGLMAVLATAGFAIGLAFQGTLSNFSAGVLLLVFRPFKVGDMVNIAGITGKINEIDLFTTTLDTPDNRRMIVPNSSISGSTIENMTFHEHRRAEVTVGVEYSASLDRTRAALTACAESMADCTIQGEGRGYQILLTSLGESSVQWTVRLWVAKDQFFQCRERLTGEIKRHLDWNEIGIPYPQLRVHMSSAGSLKSNATLERSHGTAVATPSASLSVPSIHPAEDRKARIRPRVRGDCLE